MTHALLVGPRGVGKSTLIRRVLEEMQVPVSGFFTRKEPNLAHPTLGDPVYFYPMDEPERRGPARLLGYCKDHCPQVYPDTFHRLAPQVAAMGGGQLLVMDEIGFMETCSPPVLPGRPGTPGGKCSGFGGGQGHETALSGRCAKPPQLYLLFHDPGKPG